MKKKPVNRQIDQSFAPATNGFHRKEGHVCQVLVVDDDENVRETLSWVLAGMEFGVMTARDGKEALNLFQKHDFEIVLTDLNMPNMDGMALAGHIKEWSPQTPIILISGDIKKSTMLFRSQVDYVLHKPFGIDELETAVQKILAKAESLKLLRVNASS